MPRKRGLHEGLCTTYLTQIRSLTRNYRQYLLGFGRWLHKTMASVAAKEAWNGRFIPFCSEGTKPPLAQPPGTAVLTTYCKKVLIELCKFYIKALPVHEAVRGSGWMDNDKLTIEADFLTQDPAMLNLLQMVGKIAPTEVTALIQGESGTGKELIAKRIHLLSRRRGNTLVSINCGAIQDTLLLSELFGHEKGAFTGAIAQKKGLVELAHEGTLFLDEIGEMGLEAQAKLLRFLQDGEIFRVGGKAPIHVNVRLISATNRDLEAAVKRGQFREDLYYRINTVTLRIAPLRKRPGDIPLLINQFLSHSGISHSVVRSVSPKAMELLKRYRWPGNVRELQNTVERFKILVETEIIGDNDIPFNIRNPEIEAEYFDGASTFLLSQIEKRHIVRVLNHFRGNKTKAANAMGITVKTLYNKLALYERERQEETDRLLDSPRPTRPNPGLSSPSPDIG